MSNTEVKRTEVTTEPGIFKSIMEKYPDVSEGNTKTSDTSKKRYRNFTITSFKKDPPKFDEKYMKYLAYGKEICPSTNREHWQAFVCYKNTRSLSSAIKEFKPDHIEIMRGSIEDNETYCSKEGLYTKFGTKPKQGKRTDLESLKSDLKNFKLEYIVENYFDSYIKYSNGIEKASFHLQRDRKTKPYVTWIWGKSGVGKTRYVVDKENELWINNGTLQWFDGYNNQEAVLFDDFRSSQCEFTFLLRLLDRYPLNVPIKGSFRKWNCARIYITSIHNPEECFKDWVISEDLFQITRRIDQVIHLK